MLKVDRDTFVKLLSRDETEVAEAVRVLDSLPRGHFEDHPISRRLVSEHLAELVLLCQSSGIERARIWAAQFIADARVMGPGVKDVVLENARNPTCTFLPTLLYLVGSNASHFEDAGPVLEPLAGHKDPQVRWRVAWAISKMKSRDEAVRRALAVLKRDSYDTTKVYVRAAEG